MDSLSLKVCIKCGEGKPATREFFSPDKTVTCGLTGRCKACHAAAVRVRRAADPERARAQARRDRERNPEGVAASLKRYRAKNKEAISERRRAYYHKRRSDPIELEKERARIKQNSRNFRLMNPTKAREYYERHRANNPAYTTMACARAKKYYRADPKKYIARSAGYRAIRLDAEGSFSKDDLCAAFQRQNGKCHYCGCRVGNTAGKWHADHFIPLSKGGTNHPENIVIACPHCNLTKHDRLPWDFMPDKFTAPDS